MSRIIQFVIFVTIFCAVYFGLHFFVYKRITATLLMSDKHIACLKYFFIISGCSIFIGRLLDNSFGITFIKRYSYLWFGFISIAFTVFLAGLIIKKVYPGQQALLTIFLLLLTILITGFSLFNQIRKPQIKEVELTFRKLNTDFKNFTVVQLSDLHIENSTSENWLKEIVDRTNSLKPDLIVITGDVFEEKMRSGERIFNILKGLTAKFGVLGVTGNHEYFIGIKNSEEYFSKSDIRLLRNEKISLTNSIDIYGIDDNMGKVFEKIENKGALFEQVSSKKLNILLYHRPEKFTEAIKNGIDLQLSGHTHSGQIPPLDFIVRIFFKYPYGLYNLKGAYIYTTSGTGIWGPPMRFLNSSEIVKIVIKSE